jgi:hypothetical protein
MVATGKYDVLHPLAECLLHDNAKKVHFVCLTLNNLSIPLDNKRVMTLERVSKKLISSLTKVIQSGKKDAYLCLICLMNLSYYEPAEVAIGQFSPKKGRGPKVPPLENPNSLLRILQDVTAHAARGTADFRWACGLLAVLAKHPENALLIGLTAIPKVAIENLRVSKLPPSEWKFNSLEDFSLFLLLRLAEVSHHGLDSDALEVVTPIMEVDTGIQGLKATMICAFSEVPWSTFPNYGVIAAGGVAELIGNTFEITGKKHSYADNAFSLKTAVKAYGDLARAAAKADEATDDSTNNNLKVVALPTAVALLFQIVGEIADQSMEDDSESSLDSRSDLRTAELAISAITALLPALLLAESPPRYSLHNESACFELSEMMVAFSKRTTSTSVKAKAAAAGEQILEASKSALPLLEASFDLWKHVTSR